LPSGATHSSSVEQEEPSGVVPESARRHDAEPSRVQLSSVAESSAMQRRAAVSSNVALPSRTSSVAGMNIVARNSSQ
jgi:hypothetical protein